MRGNRDHLRTLGVNLSLTSHFLTNVKTGRLASASDGVKVTRSHSDPSRVTVLSAQSSGVCRASDEGSVVRSLPQSLDQRTK